MSETVKSPEEPLYFSMDDDTLVSRLAQFNFKLDDNTWSSVEHYYQAMLFRSELYNARIASAPSSQEARTMGNTLWHRRIKNWRNKRSVLMTRAVYTQCRTHSKLAERLLSSNQRHLVESSQYDYFWGCGRDQRGRNEYGKVLMSVRSKLIQECTEH